MNPCPVLDEHSGTIFLFFIAVLGHTPEAVQIATGKNAARLCCVTSCDAGLTWGSVRDLTEEAIGAALQGRWTWYGLGWVGLVVWGGGGEWVGRRQESMGVDSSRLGLVPRIVQQLLGNFHFASLSPRFLPTSPVGNDLLTLSQGCTFIVRPVGVWSPHCLMAGLST